MKDEFKKMYPVGADDTTNVDADTPKLIFYTGTAGTLVANTYQNNIVGIQLSSTSTMTYAISNPKPGTKYIIEATGTGTNNRVVTLTGCTANATGNNTFTLDAQSESVELTCLSTTRYAITSNVGTVVFTTV